MDRTAHQATDLHAGLDATLVMLGGKIAPGVTVVKDYDRGLPEVPVYAGELNQVWTNLIVNALDAMADEGTLTVRTGRDGDCALVEIADTGPGIPAELRSRVFEPLCPPSRSAGHRSRARRLLAGGGQAARRRPAGDVGARGHPVPGGAAAHRAHRLTGRTGQRVRYRV